MSRKWTLPILMLFLCSTGTLQAHPLDSPGVVYIDGQPCNRACQSYMAWSNQALSARHRGQRETGIVVVPAETAKAVRQVARPRVARHPVPMPRPAPRVGMAALNANASNSGKAAVSNSASQPATRQIPAATAVSTGEKPAAAQPAEASNSPSEVQPEAKAEVKSDAKSEVTLPSPATLDVAAAPVTSGIAALPATAAIAPALPPRTTRQQIMEATATADRVTEITLGREAANTSDSSGNAPGQANDADKTASGTPANSDNLVALVLARPEIISLSDLNNKTIAIEQKQSAASGSVSAALMAAGAAEVQFSEAKAGAIERLISGEVPAAVLTLASREAAEWFPDIEGFRTFRVPLSLKARL